MKLWLLFIITTSGFVTGCSDVEEDSPESLEENAITYELGKDLQQSEFNHIPIDHNENLLETLEEPDKQNTEESTQDTPMDFPPKLATLGDLCLSCAKILSHIDLMLGNSKTAEQLFDIARGKNNEEIGAIYATKLVLETTNPELSESLNHYEQHVLGSLVAPSELKSVISSLEFQDYYNFLKESDLLQSNHEP